ncbi:MAG: MBL fold metallo-hydrolase, partial [Burkholderiales bacterium]|nr:MBL fold metallo-hydrolase [Burkholderiales bacterium]
PDKFNGLSVLHALGAESIGSQATAAAMPGVHAYKKYFWVNMAKAFTDETYPKFEPLKTTFSGQKTIRLKSGETLTLIELKNPGVSSTQTVLRIDSTGDLIVGDLVQHGAHLWLEGGIVDGKPRPGI